MDAWHVNKWVAALEALQAAAELTDMPSGQMRGWARHLLAGIPAAAFDEGDLDQITSAFLVSNQNRNRAGVPKLREYRGEAMEASFIEAAKGASAMLRSLQQTAPPYPQIGTSDSPSASYPANPYSSPTTYLSHPTIDVLDQETITKISTRDTGA